MKIFICMAGALALSSEAIWSADIAESDLFEKATETPSTVSICVRHKNQEIPHATLKRLPDGTVTEASLVWCRTSWQVFEYLTRYTSIQSIAFMPTKSVPFEARLTLLLSKFPKLARLTILNADSPEIEIDWSALERIKSLCTLELRGSKLAIHQIEELIKLPAPGVTRLAIRTMNPATDIDNNAVELLAKLTWVRDLEIGNVPQSSDEHQLLVDRLMAARYPFTLHFSFQPSRKSVNSKR